MRPIGKGDLVAVLRVRFDYYSAESVFELASAEAGLADQASYEVEQVIAFARALTQVSDHVEPVLERLQAMLPAGSLLADRPVAATAEAPAAEEPKRSAPEEPAPEEPAPEEPKQSAPEEPAAVTFVLRGAAPAKNQQVMVCGNLPELGEWKPEGAAALEAGSDKAYTLSLPLAPKQKIEFKFLRRTAGGDFEWEGGDNRSFTVPECGSGIIDATWQ